MEVELAVVNAVVVPTGAAAVADVAVAAAVVDAVATAADAAVLSEVVEHPTVEVGLSAEQLRI